MKISISPSPFPAPSAQIRYRQQSLQLRPSLFPRKPVPTPPKDPRFCLGTPRWLLLGLLPRLPAPVNSCYQRPPPCRVSPISQTSVNPISPPPKLFGKSVSSLLPPTPPSRSQESEKRVASINFLWSFWPHLHSLPFLSFSDRLLQGILNPGNLADRLCCNHNFICAAEIIVLNLSVRLPSSCRRP